MKIELTISLYKATNFETTCKVIGRLCRPHSGVLWIMSICRFHHHSSSNFSLN